MSVAAWRPRPLIYVYELPGEFNTHILQQRQKEINKCLPRAVDSAGTRPEAAPN